MSTEIENERRFLVDSIPGVAGWPVKFEVSKIRQTYLLGKKGTVERVRQRIWRDGRRELTHNVKTPLGPGSNMETEVNITQAEYTEHLRRADPSRTPLSKARTVFEYDGHTWELDEIFNCCLHILEVELAQITDDVTLPPWLFITREITGVPGYSNYELSQTDSK